MAAKVTVTAPKLPPGMVGRWLSVLRSVCFVGEQDKNVLESEDAAYVSLHRSSACTGTSTSSWGLARILQPTEWQTRRHIGRVLVKLPCW